MTPIRRARVLAPVWAVLALALADASAEDRFPTADVPPPLRPIDPSRLDAARSLAQAQREIERGNFPAAQYALARARSAEVLADYVALFEARLLLASGRAEDAARVAREGRERNEGRPVATAFTELLAEAKLAAGDESGARLAWQQAAETTRNADRRASLEQRIVSSHERTGSLHAALTPSGDTTVADSGISPELARQLRTSLSAEDHLKEADTRMAEGRSEEAIASYDRALAAGLAAGDAQRARLERGHALFAIRRYDEARAAFAALLPDAEARFWHARALARAGRTAAAIRELEAVGASGDRERASWALYLAATLLEDRGQTARAMAHYEQVAKQDDTDRGLDALWRVAWSAYTKGDFERARDRFQQMARRSQPLDALRPRYWAARSAESLGRSDEARRELRALTEDFPLSYYGWRAGERLGAAVVRAAQPGVSPGRSDVDPRDVERIELLIEANLDDFAQEELGAISDRVRGLVDRTSVGRLYVRTGDFHRAQRLVVDAYAESLSRGIEPGNETLWWLSWPPAYREIVSEVFPRDAVIDPALVWAVMREESGYRPWVTSSAGARGLLQIMPATGEQLARKNGMSDFDPDDLFTPHVNIALGAAYLDELGRRFPDRLSAAIGSYNAGPRAVSGWLQGDDARRDDDAWVEDIPYQQTRSYVKRVLRSLHVYRTMYGDSGLLAAPAASGG